MKDAVAGLRKDNDLVPGLLEEMASPALPADGLSSIFLLLTWPPMAVARANISNVNLTCRSRPLYPGHGHLSGRGPPGLFPRDGCGIAGGLHSGRARRRCLPLLTQAMDQVTLMERVEHQACCRLSLGEAQLLAGHLEEAQALAEHALAHARERQERGHQAYALCLLGEIAARRELPESESAEAQYRQTLTLAEELGMRPLQANCHLGLGTLYLKNGQRGQARTELATAIALYHPMDMALWLTQAEEALAQIGR